MSDDVLSTPNNPQRVHIELQRVQTWLFAAPKLRAMVGANVLLGETLRVALPSLARETRRPWKLAPAVESYPAANPSDPLKAHDDPSADAKDGILARDGGHFEAQFATGAESFTEAAALLLQRGVPGLRFSISIDGVRLTKSQVHLSTELPVLAPCEWTGRGLASSVVEQGSKNDKDYEERAVSLGVKQRHEAAKRSEQWEANDLATLLAGTTRLRELDRHRVREMKELVGNGYLALIHADGNNIGKSKPGNEAGDARFFHRNRVLLRGATQKAIDSACVDAESRAPLIPLMLGGDDLLLVCRAEIALPFVVALCRALATLQIEADGFELTLGVGVVVAQHKIPIHRLHEVAEQLATSAKRRFRGLKDADAKRSVVDWAVCSTAWVDDPEEVRRRDWLRGEGNDRRVLSQRPVDVLGHGLSTLEGLVRASNQVAGASRSQLRYLVDQLPRGRALSELAFAELPAEVKRALENLGLTTLWRPSAANRGPWLTELLDLVEIAEVARLGRVEPARSQGESPHV